jgi:hypothetical protein|tara:strand:+ start:63 stop:533 length:471 start_codon:yes stop_codon:yes gene_type:complete
MNIFVLDTEIKKCAEYHCDKHVIKMILESVQMMSSVVRLSGYDLGYKLTHKNHPCTIWARKSLANYKWLFKLTEGLNAEYRYRYNKTVNHKSYDMVKTLPMPNIPDTGLTPFAQAMPDQYKSNNAVQSYRDYYLNEKANLLTWTKRKTPAWISKQI